MEAIGKAGVSTSDALTIFGRRAGANVATISREFASGTTRFHTLLDALENSAGATEDLYTEMGKTVEFQFKVLMSAAEELQLTIFDIFRGPLQELLKEIGKTIQVTAETLALHTGLASRKAKDFVEEATEAIRQNRFALTHFIRVAVETIKQLGSVILFVLPLLDDLAIAFGTAFAAITAGKIAKSITTMGAGFLSLASSLKAIFTTLSLLSGGFVPVVAAIAAAVVAFTSLASAASSAKDEIEQLKEAHEEYAELRALIDEGEDAAAAAAVRVQKRSISMMQDELQARGELTEAIENKLEALKLLTADQVKAKFAAGELLKITVNGKTAFIDSTTALMLQVKATGLASEATEAFTEAQKAAENQNTIVQDKYNNLNSLVKAYDDLVAEGVTETIAFSGAIAQEGNTIKKVRERLAFYSDEVDKSTARLAGLAEQRQLAEDNMLRAESKRASRLEENKEKSAAAAAAAKEREAAEKALAKAIEERTAKEVDLLEPLSNIADMSEDEVVAEFQARLEAFQEASAKEIAARLKLGQDVERLREVHQQKIAEQRIFFAVEMERRDREIRLEGEKETAELIEKLRNKNDKTRLTEIEKVAKQKADALAEAENASAGQLEEINDIFAERQRDAIAAQKRQVLGVIRPHNQRVIDLEAEKNRLLLLDEQTGGQNQLAIRRHFNKLIREEEKDAARERNNFGRMLADGFKLLASEAVNAGKTVVKEVRGMTESVMGFLTELTEFEFNLFDALSDVKSEMAEVAELQDSLAAGEITQAEFDEAMLELPATIEDSARGFVQELTQGVQDNISLFIEAAPILLMELGRALPGIIQDLADAIPDIVDSFVTTLPEILQALAANIPSLVKAITDEIPTIIEVVLNEIPTIIKAFGEAIPVILTTLAEGVAQILAEVPKILRTILNQLPTIITTIFEAVDIIIIALVEAIPRVISAIIANIPTIIRSLIQGLLSSLSTIIVEVLGTLIPTLIAMIPEIVSVVMTAISVIIETLVARLPFLIAQFVRSLDSIVNALITLVPKVLSAFIRGLPRLITAIVSLIPAVIEGVIKALPKLISTLVTLFTQIGIIEIVIALVSELVPAVIAAAPKLIVSLIELLVIEIPMMVGVFVVEFVKSIPKIVQEIVKGIGESLLNLGKGIKNAFSGLGNFFSGIFGDTPGVQRAGAFGSFAGFAPGDYFAAAQSPNQLLAQALSVASPSAIQAIQAPGMEGLSVAMMQMASAIQSNGMRPAMAGQSVAVTIKADGQVLDRVMYNAGQNGNAPYAEKRARKSTLQAGRQPGFDRGKYRGG
tara:strand:+ start:1 stop:3885 length:3885 start_codon:yes stop_codon:yes gene_type:complete